MSAGLGAKRGRSRLLGEVPCCVNLSPQAGGHAVADVFISYAHEDHAFVRMMTPALEAEGFSVWWDHTIPPGKTWDGVIAAGIAEARCCIVLWSKHSVASDWVKEEATIAKDHKKFLPVQIDGSEPPVGFRRIQSAHLQDWNGAVSNPQWQMLVREVRAVIDQAGGPTGRGGQSSRTHRAYTPPPPRPGTPAWLLIATALFAVVAIGTVTFAILPELFGDGRDQATLDEKAETPPAPAPEVAKVEPPPDPCAAAQTAWRGGLNNSTDRAALQRFVNETPESCAIREAAVQRIAGLPAPVPVDQCAAARRQWAELSGSNDVAQLRRFVSETPAACAERSRAVTAIARLEAAQAPAPSGSAAIDRLFAGQPTQFHYARWMQGISDLRFTLTYSGGRVTVSNVSFNLTADGMPAQCANGMPSASTFWAVFSLRTDHGSTWSNLGSSSGLRWSLGSPWERRYSGGQTTFAANLNRADVENGSTFMWFFFAPEGVDSGCGGGVSLRGGIR